MEKNTLDADISNNYLEKHRSQADKQPLLSVIIPVFNDASRLEIALKAIFEQPYHDFEVIVIDDASIDDSYEVARRYTEKYKNCYLLRNKENKGATFSTNRGCKYAQGKYLYFGSSNDYVKEKLFQVSIDLLEKYPEFPFCASDVIGDTWSGQKLFQCLPNEAAQFLHPEDILRKKRYQKIQVFSSSMIFRASVFRQEVQWYPQLYGVADLFNYFLLLANYGCIFTHEAGSLANFKEGLSHQETRERRKSIYDQLADLLLNNEKKEKNKKLIKSGLLGHLGPRFFLYLLKTKNSVSLISWRMCLRILYQRKRDLFKDCGKRGMQKLMRNSKYVVATETKI